MYTAMVYLGILSGSLNQGLEVDVLQGSTDLLRRGAGPALRELPAVGPFRREHRRQRAALRPVHDDVQGVPPHAAQGLRP